MPTGYTAAIKDGITFEKFIWGCARAFGALVTMRDESSDALIPDKFEPSDHYAKGFENAKARYEQLKKMDINEAGLESEKEYKEAAVQRQKYTEESLELKMKYLTMLNHVKAWQPPSPDHFGLKSFMIEQIESSIKFDCGGIGDNFKPIPHLPAEEWLTKEIDKTLHNMEYYLKEKTEEEERIASRNLWLKQLRQSLSS